MAKRHTKRVKASGLGAIVGTLVLAGLSRIHGLDLSPVESGAIVGLCSYGAGFLPEP